LINPVLAIPENGANAKLVLSAVSSTDFSFFSQKNFSAQDEALKFS